MKMRTFMQRMTAIIFSIAMLFALVPDTTYAAAGNPKGGGTGSAGYNWVENYNMAITEDAAIAAGLPKDLSGSTYVKWSSCIGLWQGMDKGEVSNPVFLNGNLYIYGEKQIKKVNVQTGEIEKATNLTYSTEYNYFFQAAGDILVIQEGLYLEAFDAELNSLWVTESINSGNQGLTPLTCADGIIYGGTVGVGAKTPSGCYFAVRATDGKILWKQEAELTVCGSAKNNTGYYWTGAAAIGDYLVYGSEGGRVYAANRHTGDIVDRYDICDDASHSIRSSVAYDGDNIYFTDTFGNIYQVVFDKTTGKFGTAKCAVIGETTGSRSACTSTPVIYNNRLYIGNTTHVAVFDTTDLSPVYRVAHTKGWMRDLRLVADTANNCVYVFTSYYNSPGSVIMMKDTPGQTSGELIDFASLTTQWAQYNASMPIFGPDGTIYLTNDLGYLVAIGTNDTWLTGMEGNGTLDNSLNNGISRYELVVAPGTENAVLTLTVNDGSSLTVNGSPVSLTDNKGTVKTALTDGKATAVIKVSKGTSVRTYTVNIREAAQNAALGADLVNQSNSPGSKKTVEQLSDQVYICYEQSSTFMRLWIKPEDANATQAVYALTKLGERSKVDADTGLIGNSAAGSGTGAGYLRWHLYWEGDIIAVKAVITAEDGVTTSERYYIITQKSKADFTGSDQEKETLFMIGRDAALTELKAYYAAKNPDLYRQEQKTELSALLAAGMDAIEKAESQEQINAALADTKAKLDGVKTDEQLTAAEKEAADKEAADAISPGTGESRAMVAASFGLCIVLLGFAVAAALQMKKILCTRAGKE